MRSGMIVAMTVLILAGSWESAGAQAAKPAKATKTATAKPVETVAPVETAAVPVAEAADTVAPGDTTVPDTTHHKRGLFGKAKSVMKNKVVQQVVKTAACTMVPGGQAIAGAIDAASSKSAGEAAAGAASGTSCMPGMGGAGMAGAGMGAAGLAGGGGAAGLAGPDMVGAMADKVSPGIAALAPGMATPGMMPGGGYGMVDPKPMADCMGLTVEEYNAMTNPTGSEPRQMTKAESKRMQQLSKKVGSQRQMACSQTVGMQQAGAQMAQMQQMMAAAQQQGRAGVPQGMEGMPGMGGGGMTEAPGEQVALSRDLAAELAKGKTVMRSIDWVVGSAEVSPGSRAGFEEALTTLAQAIRASGQRYRLDLYLDERYDDAAVQQVGPLRLQLVQSTLAALLDDAASVETGKTKRDKNPRLEVVKSK